MSPFPHPEELRKSSLVDDVQVLASERQHLANKIARIAWAVMTSGESYREPEPPASPYSCLGCAASACGCGAA
jgi:hypothetical protein